MIVHIESEVAVETGKLGIIPSRHPVEGPMSEYCVHLRVPHGEYPVYAYTAMMKSKNGWVNAVERIVIPFREEDQQMDKPAARIYFDEPWILAGDITFLHNRIPRGSGKVDCSYGRAMSALRKSRNHISRYESEGGTGIVVRLAMKGGRLPTFMKIDDGVVRMITIETDRRFSVDLD